MFILKFEFLIFKIKKAAGIWSDMSEFVCKSCIVPIVGLNRTNGARWRACWAVSLESSRHARRPSTNRPTMSAAFDAPYEDPFPCISGYAVTPRDRLLSMLYICFIKIGRIKLVSCRQSNWSVSRTSSVEENFEFWSQRTWLIGTYFRCVSFSWDERYSLSDIKHLVLYELD